MRVLVSSAVTAISISAIDVVELEDPVETVVCVLLAGVFAKSDGAEAATSWAIGFVVVVSLFWCSCSFCSNLFIDSAIDVAFVSAFCGLGV